MIKAILVFNNHGKPRLSKFYQYFEVQATAKSSFKRKGIMVISTLSQIYLKQHLSSQSQPSSTCGAFNEEGADENLSYSRATCVRAHISAAKQVMLHYYVPVEPGRNEDMQQQIIKETFQLVSKRDDNVCNFLEGGSLIGGSDYKLIYRHYATLYFVFCVDSSESELGILDLIQVFVETLDKCFENVCELDLIFHADAAHQVLDELVMGGMVLQTNMADILCRLHEQNKMQKAEAGISAAPARAVSAVKSMNLPQQLRDMKLPDLPQAIKAYPASPVTIATNILHTIYPPTDKYQNIHPDISNKFFGSESLSTRFSETFSENYQQTEGINFPDYEGHKSEGYQDISGTVCDYADGKKRKKKKKGKH